MLKTAAPKRDLYRELPDLPENMVGEIIDGGLYSQPRPSPRHSLASSSLGDELVSPFQKGRGGPGGWWILDEPEIHLDRQVMVPDIAGWKKDRLPQLPETAWFELAPDWVCEVLSPSTARGNCNRVGIVVDRMKKIHNRHSCHKTNIPRMAVAGSAGDAPDRS